MPILNITAAAIGILLWAPSVLCNGYVFIRQAQGIYWGPSPIPIAGSLAGLFAIMISTLPISSRTVLLGLVPDILWILGMAGGAVCSRLLGPRIPPWEREPESHS